MPIGFEAIACDIQPAAFQCEFISSGNFFFFLLPLHVCARSRLLMVSYLQRCVWNIYFPTFNIFFFHHDGNMLLVELPSRIPIERWTVVKSIRVSLRLQCVWLIFAICCSFNKSMFRWNYLLEVLVYLEATQIFLTFQANLVGYSNRLKLHQQNFNIYPYHYNL